MPTPPLHSGPVLLSECPVPYSVARKNPLTVNGGLANGWRGDITFRVAAKDMYTFCGWAAGQQYTVGSVVRYVPLSHPDAKYLICTDINSETAGGYTATNTEVLQNWSDAFVRCTFTTVPFPADGSTPFIVVNARRGSEVYTLAGSKLKFPSDGSYINADAGVTVGTTVYTCTISLAATLNDSVLDPLVGSVNSDVQALLLSKPIGTLRFDGFDSETTTLSNGQIAYTRTLMLTFRNVPWNQFLRPDGVWEAPQTPGGANVYTAAPFAPLVA